MNSILDHQANKDHYVCNCATITEFEKIVEERARFRHQQIQMNPVMSYWIQLKSRYTVIDAKKRGDIITFNGIPIVSNPFLNEDQAVFFPPKDNRGIV